MFCWFIMMKYYNFIQTFNPNKKPATRDSYIY